MQDALNIHQFSLNYFQRRDLWKKSTFSCRWKQIFFYEKIQRPKGILSNRKIICSWSDKLSDSGNLQFIRSCGWNWSPRHSVQLKWIVMIFCACAWASVCVFSVRESGIICSKCAKVFAKPLDSSKPNWKTKQTFHSSIYFKWGRRGKDRLFQERRYRCSTLKTKRIGRNTALADG